MDGLILAAAADLFGIPENVAHIVLFAGHRLMFDRRDAKPLPAPNANTPTKWRQDFEEQLIIHGPAVLSRMGHDVDGVNSFGGNFPMRMSLASIALGVR